MGVRRAKQKKNGCIQLIFSQTETTHPILQNRNWYNTGITLRKESIFTLSFGTRLGQFRESTELAEEFRLSLCYAKWKIFLAQDTFEIISAQSGNRKKVIIMFMCSTYLLFLKYQTCY